jgi:chemotaxis protein methyltransferase CheR
MIDLLTTNETYFFREPQHFDFLRDVILKERRGAGTFRIWSGASSSGEEAYSMAMVLAEHCNDGAWEVFGSDISLTVLARAQAGGICAGADFRHSARLLAQVLPEGHTLAGRQAVDRQPLKQRVRFAQVNLTQPITGVGDFDVIFLRNVMIYFDAETKRKVIENMLPHLKPNGYFIVGHSESLHGISNRLQALKPTIYRRPR